MPIAPDPSPRHKPKPKPSASPTQSIGGRTTAFPGHVDDPIGENDNRVGVYGRTDDPAKFLVKLGRFERPSFSVIGGDIFEWPLGIEGIVISGAATLAEHKYIGDNAVVIQVMHRDDRRIQLTGMFPGVTGSTNMRNLLAIIVAESSGNGKILNLPGVLPKQALVEVDTYNFTHPEEDQNDSWNYEITFRSVGTSKKIPRPKVITAPSNPVNSRKGDKGKTAKVFVVKDGYRTLRAISRKVYGNANAWNKLYSKNKKVLDSLGVPTVQLPTRKLPLGMRLQY